MKIDSSSLIDRERQLPLVLRGAKLRFRVDDQTTATEDPIPVLDKVGYSFLNRDTRMTKVQRETTDDN